MRAVEAPYRIGPLTDQGWRQAIAWDPAVRQVGISNDCAATLPALYDRDGLLEVPRLDLRRPNAVSGAQQSIRTDLVLKMYVFWRVMRRSRCVSPCDFRALDYV